MAREDIVPTLLAQIFNRAIPDPVDDNSPFQGFNAPVDEIVLDDTVVAVLSVGPPYGYGQGGVGGAPLLTSPGLVTGPGVLTADGVYFCYGGPGRYGG